MLEKSQPAGAPRPPGTGLGLTTTRKLVELMGGSIHGTSLADGGTTFEVRLPAPLVAPARHERSAGERGASQPLGGRLLIAEDNESLRYLLAAWMRELQIKCRLVANGLGAVEEAFAGEYDAVLMDMEMPLMDGYEAVRVLRERGYAKPIIAFTTHQDGPEVERAMREGCSAVLTKPTTIDKLRGVLEPFLAKAAQPE